MTLILALAAKLLVVNHLLVPLLLGIKLKIITLLPIIFGFIALIATKALILSKISLIISSALGLGSLLLGTSSSNIHGPGAGPFFNQPYAPPYHINRFPEHHYEDNSYRTNAVGKSIVNNEDVTNDQIKLPENLHEIFSTGVGANERESRRNFAWSEEEKLKKNV